MPLSALFVSIPLSDKAMLPNLKKLSISGSEKANRTSASPYCSDRSNEIFFFDWF